MSKTDRRVSTSLANGSEFPAMWEIVAHTGMVVIQANGGDCELVCVSAYH